MSDIMNSINDINMINRNINAFYELPRQDKLQLLTNMKIVTTEATGIFYNSVLLQEKDKEVRKIIKKLLFRLKTAGIRVDELRPSGEPVLKMIEDTREHKGLFGNYAGDGTRLLSAAFELKKNHFMFVHAIAHFSKGLMELRNAPMERRTLEQVLAGYLNETPKPSVVVEASPGYVTYLIEEASLQSAKYFEEVKELRQFTSRIRDGIRKPEDIYTLQVPDHTDSLPLEKVLSISIFEPFMLTWETMEHGKTEFNDIEKPTIIVPPYVVEDKKQMFLKTLTESDQIKESIPLIKRMITDYAYILYCLKEFSAYKSLIEALKDEGAFKAVLSFFLRKSLIKAADTPPGLIVNPYGQIRR